LGKEESIMKDAGRQLARSHDVGMKVTRLLQKRTELARDHYAAQLRSAYENVAPLMTNPIAAAGLWTGAYDYAVDAAQRSILFWDTLRQRGNNFIEHERQGWPPVLHFDYEMVMDGRSMKRAVEAFKNLKLPLQQAFEECVQCIAAGVPLENDQYVSDT